MPKTLQIKAGKVDGSRSSATAFVRFSSREEATAALAANMSVVNSVHLRVDLAAAPSSKAGAVQYEPKRSVFLGNLAFDTTVRC
jgi:RNA recognition motif-containing protein